MNGLELGVGAPEAEASLHSNVIHSQPDGGTAGGLSEHFHHHVTVFFKHRLFRLRQRHLFGLQARTAFASLTPRYPTR